MYISTYLTRIAMYDNDNHNNNIDKITVTVIQRKCNKDNTKHNNINNDNNNNNKKKQSTNNEKQNNQPGYFSLLFSLTNLFP